MTYADKLRAFADYLDDHPYLLNQIGVWDYPTNGIWADDADHFGRICRAMGSFEKSGYNGTITARHTETDDDQDRQYGFTVHLSGVCESRPVLDDDGNPKVRVVEAQPARTEPVVEWVCPESFLNL